VPVEAFSQEWAEAWADALNGSEAYRTVAATWEGAVALVMNDGPPETRRAVLLDLWHGECRQARAADAENLGGAVYVFEGARAAWRQILGAGSSPVLALMTGRIKLVKGQLGTLLPYASAAKQLLELAGSVPTRFAEG
jgi:putative sterol carrier protein